MAAFATVEDFSTYVQPAGTEEDPGELDAQQSATAAFMLDIASDMIRGFVGWDFDEGTDTDRALEGKDKQFLRLPFAPVNSITSITNNGEIVTAGTASVQYTLYGSEGVLYRESGWGDVVVTYAHGFAAIPNDVKGVCCDIVKRAFVNPSSLPREDLDPVSRLELSEGNIWTLRRYVPLIV